MQKFFVRHKLTEGDIAYLSDSDSDIVISKKELNVESLIQIETYEKKFLAQITDISKSSVEIEVLEELGQRDIEYTPSITLIQSLSNDSKFNYFVEKSVEIGIERIVPIESKYSLIKKNKALKNYGFWNKIVKDATEQSRNLFPTIIEKPIYIRELGEMKMDGIKLCLSTEAIDTVYLNDLLPRLNTAKPMYIAIGPEKGWDFTDLEIFKALDFQFVKLKGNILRTETTGLVIGSIIKYIKGEL